LEVAVRGFKVSVALKYCWWERYEVWIFCPWRSQQICQQGKRLG